MKKNLIFCKMMVLELISVAQKQVAGWPTAVLHTSIFFKDNKELMHILYVFVVRPV